VTIRAAENDRSGVRRFEAGDEPQQRRFSTARRTEQRQKFARVHGQAHAIDRSD